MARKRAQPEHENHERWLISYADFITLLFAFFVVMFASSQADKNKAQQVSESVKTALEKGAQASAKQFVPRGREEPKGKGGSEPPSRSESAQAAVAAELAPSLKVLNKALSHEIETGKIEVHMEARGLVVSLHEGGFFGSGDDKIIPASYPSIAKIASVVGTLDNPIRLEGHTDSVPIHTERFDSNWDLSAARSIAMLNLLAVRYSIHRQRFGIAGYADTMPVDTNITPTGRARNRRVDLVVLNNAVVSDSKSAPIPAPATSKPEPAPAAKQTPAAPAKPATTSPPKPSPVSPVAAGRPVGK
jgi:chemotaxis protein MotB